MKKKHTNARSELLCLIAHVIYIKTNMNMLYGELLQPSKEYEVQFVHVEICMRFS